MLYWTGTIFSFLLSAALFVASIQAGRGCTRPANGKCVATLVRADQIVRGQIDARLAYFLPPALAVTWS